MIDVDHASIRFPTRTGHVDAVRDASFAVRDGEVFGLVGIAYWEDMQRTAELADIDAAMLSDDLPLNAYLDHGFNAYLSHAR